MDKNFNLQKFLAILEDNIEFQVGDEVYHKTDSNIGKGIIIEVRIFTKISEISYLVNFGPGIEYWLPPCTLSTSKPIEI